MYDCHVIIDLEFAPIDRKYKKEREILRHEIIQIGAILLDEHYVQTGTFTSFVKPRYLESIDPDVSKLTGIQNKDLVDAPPFEEALQALVQWIGPEDYARIYSWSHTDLYQMEDECYLKEVDFPPCMYRWMDFQKVYGRLLGCHKKIALKDAISSVDGAFTSAQAHTALYDAQVTTDLLLLVRDEQAFREKTARIRKLFASERCSSNIGQMFGDQLSALFK